MVKIEKLDMERTELIRKIGKLFPNGKGVEVGTFKGTFAREILLNWPGHLYMVDVWRGLNDNEYQDGSNHSIHKDAFELTMLNIDGFEDRATMIRTKSTQGADLFQDNSLDFVYIDANHAYDYVVEDIKTWYPKVKKGSYLLGHDYLDIDWNNNEFNILDNGKDIYLDKPLEGQEFNAQGIFGVNPAVHEFCEQYNITDLKITKEFFGSWIIKK
jgi:hypothetical protein